MENNLYNPHLRTKKTTRSIMGDVCLALLPAAIGSVVFFGINALILMFVSVLTCVACEVLWQVAHKQTVTIGDLSAVVTGILLAFNVSSNTPVWVVILAGAFSILVVKQMFGGIGSNVFNPALMGRLFIMAVGTMGSYAEPLKPDAVSSATVLAALKEGAESTYSVLDSFIGKVPGALGETSALLLLIGFAYLVIRKEVNWQASAGFFAAIIAVALMSGQNPLVHLFAGGAILGGCFMLTDYNLTGKKGKVLYGLLAGVLVMVFRRWSLYPEGVCFAILIVNCVSVLLDKASKKHVYGK